MLENLPKTYDPKDFEDRLYKYWNDSGHFVAYVDKDKKPFTIMMPPDRKSTRLNSSHL